MCDNLNVVHFRRGGNRNDLETAVYLASLEIALMYRLPNFIVARR